MNEIEFGGLVQAKPAGQFQWMLENSDPKKHSQTISRKTLKTYYEHRKEKTHHDSPTNHPRNFCTCYRGTPFGNDTFLCPTTIPALTTIQYPPSNFRGVAPRQSRTSCCRRPAPTHAGATSSLCSLRFAPCLRQPAPRREPIRPLGHHRPIRLPPPQHRVQSRHRLAPAKSSNASADPHQPTTTSPARHQTWTSLPTTRQHRHDLLVPSTRMNWAQRSTDPPPAKP